MDRKRDGVVCDVRDVPLSVRPVVRAAVQSVVTVVHLELVSLPVEGELGVADAVGVAAWDGVVDRVVGVRSCCPSEQNFNLNPGFLNTGQGWETVSGSGGERCGGQG